MHTYIIHNLGKRPSSSLRKSSRRNALWNGTKTAVCFVLIRSKRNNDVPAYSEGVIEIYVAPRACSNAVYRHTLHIGSCASWYLRLD